jgi:hypothetical protein
VFSFVYVVIRQDRRIIPDSMLANSTRTWRFGEKFACALANRYLGMMRTAALH